MEACGGSGSVGQVQREDDGYFHDTKHKKKPRTRGRRFASIEKPLFRTTQTQISSRHNNSWTKASTPAGLEEPLQLADFLVLRRVLMTSRCSCAGGGATWQEWLYKGTNPPARNLPTLNPEIQNLIFGCRFLMGLDAGLLIHTGCLSSNSQQSNPPSEDLWIRKILTPDVDEHIDKTTCTKCSAGVLSVPYVARKVLVF